MKRLDFVLPEWTRHTWASDEARDVWRPRFQRIVSAWSDIEILSVKDGVREAALIRSES